MSNTVIGTQYETTDDILRTVIAWELVGLSVNELYELAREWDSSARLGATPADRRYARAIVAAASGDAVPLGRVAA